MEGGDILFKQDQLDKIAAKKEKWAAKLEATVKKRPEREAQFATDSGFVIDTVYTPLNLKDMDYDRDLGLPGEFPYTRGVQPNVYRGRLWTMRQYAGFGSAEETNQRFRYLLEQGQTGLSCAFDLPTQIGYDSDHQLARGEIGKVGVAIDSLADMETLFDQIPLGKVSTSMTINAPAGVLLAMYIACAEKQGFTKAQINGTIQNDVIKEYICRGTYILPPEPSMRLISNIFEFCAKEVPTWNTISISGYHIREAGATAAQEIAFTLADGIAYVDAAIKAGLEVDAFAGRLSFFFNAHLNFLEEVAKFRAARRIWAKLMRDRFGAKDPRSWTLRFHTQTAGVSLTAQQPMVNIMRTAFEALSAVLGGTQSLHTNSYDEALALPCDESVMIALRTQHVIGYEIGVCDVVDPLGGSFYIEALTNALEEKAMEYIAKIDALGGAVKAIEYMQKEIHNSAYQYQLAIDNKKKTVIGVNRFQMTEKPIEGLLKVDLAVGDRQVAKLKKMKAGRDQAKVAALLKKVRDVAQSDDNLMPVFIEAVKEYVTLGEICGVLREVFGEYKQQIVF
jgi:methylmalonyl-CoA mutase N-terminal domain/subunit